MNKHYMKIIKDKCITCPRINKKNIELKFKEYRIAMSKNCINFFMVFINTETRQEYYCHLVIDKEKKEKLCDDFFGFHDKDYLCSIPYEYYNTIDKEINFSEMKNCPYYVEYLMEYYENERIKSI